MICLIIAILITKHVQGMLFWPSPGLNSVASLAVCWTAPCYRLGWDQNRRGTPPAPGKTALLWSPVLARCWHDSTLHKSHPRWSLILPSWNHTELQSNLFIPNVGDWEKLFIYQKVWGIEIKMQYKKELSIHFDISHVFEIFASEIPQSNWM